jgi:HSP20 family protein
MSPIARNTRTRGQSGPDPAAGPETEGHADTRSGGLFQPAWRPEAGAPWRRTVPGRRAGRCFYIESQTYSNRMAAGKKTSEIQPSETNAPVSPRRSRSDPWTELDRTFDNLRSRFYEAFGAPFGFTPVAYPGASDSFLRAAATDVVDTGKSYKIVAEIPGISKDKLDIRVRGTSVEIRAENQEERKEKQQDVIHQERTYRGFYRHLELPEPVLAKDASAKVENGLLELELPKQNPEPDEARISVK